MLIKQEETKADIKFDTKCSTFNLIPTKAEEIDDKKFAVLPATSTFDTDITVKVEENKNFIKNLIISSATSTFDTKNIKVKTEENENFVKKEETKEICFPWFKQETALKTESISKLENASELFEDKKKICVSRSEMDFSRIPIVELVRIPEIEVNEHEAHKKVLGFSYQDGEIYKLNTSNKRENCVNQEVNTVLSKQLILPSTLIDRVMTKRKTKKTEALQEKEHVRHSLYSEEPDVNPTADLKLAPKETIIDGLQTKPFPCTQCQKSFKTNGGLKLHFRVHATVKDYICKDCGKTSYDKAALKSHTCLRKLHFKKDICKTCNKFISKGYKNIHERMHTKTKPFSCVECGKSFSDKKYLKLHLQVHSGVKPNVCQFCDKSFAQRPHLNRHMLLHTGVKPFTCTVCSKQFRDKSNLRVHMIYHSGTRPFKCDQCDKDFTQSSHLNIHKRSAHSDSRPLSCDICGMRFKQRLILQSHLWTHSDIKPLKCEVCQHSFIQTTYFKNHKCRKSGQE